MYYYEVLVSTTSKLNVPLVYKATPKLARYQVVKVSLRKKPCYGIIWRSLDKRTVSVKNILEIVSVTDYILPPEMMRACRAYQGNSALHLSGLAQLLLSNLPKNSSSRRKAFNQKKVAIKKQPLTKDQKQIYQEIQDQTDNQVQLLLGINASGKTRIYAEIIKDTLGKGRSALVLVPEIGLSAQTLSLLQDSLTEPIVHFHSQMTSAQRSHIWRVVYENKQPLVLLGSRSTTFLPLQNLGLIVLDEFHDDSFRQNNQPAYNCLPLAVQLALAHKAQLLCGSATPRVEDFYRFKKRRYPIHYLQKPALPSKRPKVTILDKNNFTGNFAHQALIAIKESLLQDRQALIFHNRRGHWRLIICRECQKRLHCLRCQGILVFHYDIFRLCCHTCGAKEAPLSACPHCRTGLHYTVPGSKALIDELKTFLSKENMNFPVHRFDSDNLSKETLAVRIKSLKKEPCVILGTQIIGQGLDLPLLQTVVISDAEQSLVTSDYRTQEKYYQHLHQLTGRVGRGHLPQTEVIVQTTDPENPILNYAVKQDWLAFYKHELAERQRYNMPPFSRLGKITLHRSSKNKATAATRKAYLRLQNAYPSLEFYPSEPLIMRGGKWRCRIYVRSPNKSDLLPLAAEFKQTPDYFYLDPPDLT